MLLKNKLEKIKSLLNNDNVLAKLEERYCYAEDALNYNTGAKVPDLVVFVETIEQVQNIVKYANEHRIPIISRGAGTNMVGACVCNSGGIVLNFSKMNKILEVNVKNMTVRVQPGVVLGDLKSVVEQSGLFYPPDPSNYKVSTVGGSIAQASGGAKSFKYGTTKDYVLSLKVVMADGSLLEFGMNTSKSSSGYHIEQLIVGSEGTLAVIVEATLKLITKPEASATTLAYFNSSEDLVESIYNLSKSGLNPAAIDFMDNNSIKTVEDFMGCGLKTQYAYLLLLEFDGEKKQVSIQAKEALEILKSSGAVYVYSPDSVNEAELLWKARSSSYSAATRLAPDVISDDIIVPKDKLVLIIDKCNEVAKKYSLNVCMVGHLGDANLHPQFVLDLNNENDFRNYQLAKSEIYSYVGELGGTISAEHGIGIEKIEYLEKILDKKAIDYMRFIKKSFDPNNILNPGKIFRI